MPPRKRQIPDSIRQAAITPLLQSELDSTGSAADKLAAVDQATDEFQRLNAKIPSVTNATLRQTERYLRRFYEYVERRYGEGNRTADLEYLIRRVPEWLTFVVEHSCLSVAQPSPPEVDHAGQNVKRYMSDVSLISTAKACSRFVWVAVNASSERLKIYLNAVDEHVSTLIRTYGLARETPTKDTAGPTEVLRMANKALDAAQDGSVRPALLNTIVFVLMLLYTGVRRSSILEISDYPDRYLPWRDIRLTPLRQGRDVIGVHAEITFNHFKGRRLHNSLSLRFEISSPASPTLVALDLPLSLLALACRRGILVYSGDLTNLLSSAFTADIYNFDPLRIDEPVLSSISPKGDHFIHLSGMKADLMGRQVRDLVEQAGVATQADSKSLNYRLRRGFINRVYANPDLGPSLARLLAGHTADSTTIEKYYLVPQTQGNSCGPTAGLATVAPHQSLQIDQVTRDLLLRARLLEVSVSAGSDAWKHKEPFLSDKHEYGQWGTEEAIALYHEYRCKIRQRQVRLNSSGKFEATGTEAEKGDGDGDGDGVEEEREVMLRPSMEGMDEGEHASGVEELKTMRIEHLQLLTALPRGPQPCPLCATDSTCTEEDRSRLWEPYALRERHLMGVPTDIGWSAAHPRAFHHPRQQLERFLVSHKLISPAPNARSVICSPCGDVISRATLPAHLLSHHRSSLGDVQISNATILRDELSAAREATLMRAQDREDGVRAETSVLPSPGLLPGAVHDSSASNSAMAAVHSAVNNFRTVLGVYPFSDVDAERRADTLDRIRAEQRSLVVPRGLFLDRDYTVPAYDAEAFARRHDDLASLVRAALVQDVDASDGSGDEYLER